MTRRAATLGSFPVCCWKAVEPVVFPRLMDVCALRGFGKYKCDSKNIYETFHLSKFYLLRKVYLCRNAAKKDLLAE